ncbi:hypothetical protein [Rubrivirga sp.]|uniref:hypothetical protein n=1 Tax=Rubrivirga sp. TaxID=1885344 RepID=UPI003C70F4DA
MRLLLGLLVLTTAACAQPGKPDLEVDADRSRRADSAITSQTAPSRADTGCDDGGGSGRRCPDLGPLRSERPALPAGVRQDTAIVTVGDLEVAVVTHRVVGADGTSDAFWAVNLHDNESTSVDAALEVAAETGGVVVELQHTGDRNIQFDAGGMAVGADPNRIFTDAGRQRTLDALTDGPGADRGIEPVTALADHVLTQTGLEDAAVVVTLHNNTDERYSAASYLAGAEYASDAAAVSIEDGSDSDDFFFVTDRELYDALVGRGFNAVLQDNAAATDDGSLSVWAAQNERPYVNVEAQHGHRAEQARMIRALVEVLAER